jgi:hypothetical protein
MPAKLVPHEKIPELAGQTTPEMLKVLQRINQADFIVKNDEIGSDVESVLKRLTELGLVDPGYEAEASGSPYMWVANGNGSRVLAYKTGIRGGPHRRIESTALAAWLEDQGADSWWSVDGDPLLTGRLTFSCPAPRLAEELRKINRPLLIQAKDDDGASVSKSIRKEEVDELVGRIGTEFGSTAAEERKAWSDDRVLYLCWEDDLDEWLLVEDGETTALMKAVEASHARTAAGRRNK